MDCTQVLVDSEEEDNGSIEDDRRQVASLIVNGEYFPIFLGENKIGRDASSCSVVVSSLALSSKHAVIEGLECGVFLIHDLNSRNKTKIGKMTLTPSVKYKLKDGDIVRFGNVSSTFRVERVERKSNSLDDDFPCTQAIEDDDTEEDKLADVDSGRTLVKGERAIVRDFMKTPKASAKDPDEHIFKIPVATPNKSINDSFGLLNESRDSSCRADSDDEIFDLLTQPSAPEPAASEEVGKNVDKNIKNQAGGNHKPSGDDRNIDDDDDIFSAATEDFSVAHKEKGSSVTKDGVDKNGDASDDGGLTDEEGLFSADTEGFPPKPKDRNVKMASEGSPKITDHEHSSISKEGDATDEDDLFSAATEDFQVKIPVMGVSKTRGVSKRNNDAWEEYGVTDEDELFSAATEGLPGKPDKSVLKKCQGAKSFEEKKASKDDITDEEDIFSAATEAFPSHPSIKTNASAKGDEDTDDEDIFSAATEALPSGPSKKKPYNINSKKVISKNSDASDEGDTTDDEDIFSAATEALPGQSRKKMMKRCSKRKSSAQSVDASKEDDDTDEDAIFSAATEALPGEFSGKKTFVKNSKKDVAKNIGEWDGEVTDEDNIFSAATEALPGQSPKKKMLKPCIDKASIPEDGDVTDEDGIFTAATEALPDEISSKEESEKNSRKPAEAKIASEGEITDEEDIFSVVTQAIPSHSSNEKISKRESAVDGGGVCEDDDLTDEEDVFAAATEAPPALSSPLKKSETKPENALSKYDDGDDQVTDEDDIFSAATEAIPTSPSGQRKDGKSVSKSGDMKALTEKKENCENEGFVKDFLSVSDSEHGGCRQGGSTALVTQSFEGNSAGKLAGIPTDAQKIKSGVESDGGETDVEDALDLNTNEREKKIHSKAQSEAKDSFSSIGKSKNAASDCQNLNLESASKNNQDGINAPVVVDPNASIVVISDTDGEDDDDESYVNSTMEKSNENKTVGLSAIGHGKSLSCYENKTAMMTIDETLPPSRIISTQIGQKKIDDSSTGERHAFSESNKTEKSTAIHVSNASKPSDKNAESQISNPKNVQNQSVMTVDNDEDEILVAETPVCSRNTRRKGLQISRKEEVAKEVEEDMSSFLTEAPPDFQTPLVGRKRTSSGIEDISDFEIQPTPKLTTSSRSAEEKGMVEGDEEEEDMSSFLTQAPPDFKTPECVAKKVNTTHEDDMSELLTQPAPVSSDTHSPSRGEEEKDEEDMSSFLTEAPPEFKTPLAGVKQIIAEEEDDLSDLATQPAPKSAEKEQENEDGDMSSFLTEAPPEFKTPLAGVKQIIAEEEDDLSDLATQPAPKSAEKEQENEDEDMSSFLTEVPPQFKTPVMGVQKVVAEEEDWSDLMTQPAPGSEGKENEVTKRSVGLCHLEASPEFKTPVSVAPKLAEEEDDMSDLATQPAPRSAEKEQENEEVDTGSSANKVQPECKAVAQMCLEEEEDWSDLGTQPVPITEDKVKEAGQAEDGKPSQLSAEPDFKIPRAVVKSVRVEKEPDEDLSDLATQPAPVDDDTKEEECKTSKGHDDVNAEEDFSDLLTQQAPVIEEVDQIAQETNTVSAMIKGKLKASGQLVFSSDKEDDLSELETQPAPVEEDLQQGVTSCLPSAGQENQSQEDDFSLLDTQPAPTSHLPDDQEKSNDVTLDKMRVRDGKKKSASMAAFSHERVLSFKGRAHLLRNVGSPKKPFPSPGKGRKAVNIFADLSVHAREDDSSDSDLDFSASLPDTPDLLATLQETGNKFVPAQTTCRNLFDSKKQDELPVAPKPEPSKGASNAVCVSKAKGASKAEGASKAKGLSKGLEKIDDRDQEKQAKSDMLKASEKAKTNRNTKNTSYPTKKSKKDVEESHHLDAKSSDIEKETKGFEKETEVTVAGMNDMPKVKNSKSKEVKSKTSLLRDAVVTSTPINRSVEHVQTPPEPLTNAPNEKAKPTRRYQGKRGGVKNKVEHGVEDLISPVVCLVDVVKSPPSLRKVDPPTTQVDDSRKGHILRLKKPADSLVAANAGAKESKIRSQNVLDFVGNVLLDDHSDESLKGKGLRRGSKRNAPPSVGELAPVTKAAAKRGRGRKKGNANEADLHDSGEVIQPAEFLEKIVVINESFKGAVAMGETNESSSVDAELSPVMFYGKKSKDDVSGKAVIDKSDSSVNATLKKSALGNETHDDGVSVNTSVGSTDAIRRSGRERKPKKRFGVECSPVKPKKMKSDLKSYEPIPARRREAREEKSIATRTDSGIYLSQEMTLPSDSIVNISRKRVSGEPEKISKRVKVDDVGSFVKAFTRGGSRNGEEEPVVVKGSVDPPAKKVGEISKLSLKAHDLRESVVDKKNSVEGKEKKEDGGGVKGSGRGRRKRGIVEEASAVVGVSDTVSEETSDAIKLNLQNIMKGVSLELRKESNSDTSERTSASQKRGLRGKRAAGSEINKNEQSGLKSASSAMTTSSLGITNVDNGKKEEEQKGIVGGTSSGASRSRRRKVSPAPPPDKNIKEDKGGMKEGVYCLSPKVVPMRISRGRVVDAGSMKSSEVAVDSPLYNKSVLGERVQEEKVPSRVRKQKKESVNVLFTGLSDPKLNHIVERLGGSVVDTPQNCNVLVTDRLRRTYKLLCAIGRGIPIVTAQWLSQSSFSGKFLDPMDFLVSDKVTEKRFDFSLKSSLEKARVKPMLTGYRFIATPSVKPPPEEVQGIVTSAGGQYIPNLKALESKVTPLCYVVSCADDSHVWDEFTEVATKKVPRVRSGRGKAASAKAEGPRAKLIGVEGLLLSVLRQKPDLENKEFSLR
ncbi:uncharacterized protein LOC124158902 [Ischnura elegans]|uniref:uncharacterized protein LOC124158902 n=1 Tax=Ischnura elegans TaxID=197161 RepID=UPI001ED875BE|nr:uncharacterized protein LOC124158902 [Ischnura elegans]